MADTMTSSDRWVLDDGSLVRDADGFRIYGSICPACGWREFPQSAWCASCLQGPGLDVFELPLQGSLYAFSEVFIGPERLRPRYVAGLVELATDLRVFARSTSNAAQLRMGQSVRLRPGIVSFDSDDSRVWGYVFEPCEESA